MPTPSAHPAPVRARRRATVHSRSGEVLHTIEDLRRGPARTQFVAERQFGDLPSASRSTSAVRRARVAGLVSKWSTLPTKSASPRTAWRVALSPAGDRADDPHRSANDARPGTQPARVGEHTATRLWEGAYAGNMSVLGRGVRAHVSGGRLAEWDKVDRDIPWGCATTSSEAPTPDIELEVLWEAEGRVKSQ